MKTILIAAALIALAAATLAQAAHCWWNGYRMVCANPPMQNRGWERHRWH